MNKVKTVILCGGTGYRLKEETEFKPKPMVEVGGKPMLWHIMKIYSHWGFNDFIIALGYKGNIIKDYFVNKKYYDGDFRLNTSSNTIIHYKRRNVENFKITFVDTGLESSTGERVRRVKKYIDGDTFMLTYGDGVTDMNIKSLFKFHLSKKRLATFTGVFPMLKYGGADVDENGLVTGFDKKAKIRQIINGGFMVMNRKVLDMIPPNSMVEEVFNPLMEKKQLGCFRHEGFFHCMDTYQDMEDLNQKWQDNPLWKVWS